MNFQKQFYCVSSCPMDGSNGALFEKMSTMQLAKPFQHDPHMLVKQQAADFDDQTALIQLQEHY